MFVHAREGKRLLEEGICSQARVVDYEALTHHDLGGLFFTRVAHKAGILP